MIKYPMTQAAFDRFDAHLRVLDAEFRSLCGKNGIGYYVSVEWIDRILSFERRVLSRLRVVLEDAAHKSGVDTHDGRPL